MNQRFSRRRFLAASAATVAAERLRGTAFAAVSDQQPLKEVDYNQVTLTSPPHLAQLENTHSVLMGLSNDSLLKPMRAMVGMPAPGENLGGWYEYKADYDYRKDDAGFAPSATFGQWVSALCRYHAGTGDAATRAKVLELNRLYAATIAPAFYEKNRFPAYCYDKLVCGLMDSHRLLGDRDAFPILNHTTDVAEKHLPGHAVDHDKPWRPGKDISWSWDESYTMPENLFLVYAMGAGPRYLKLAQQYLDDATYFDPLSRGENVLGGHHAYSYVNALCSAMQAYMVGAAESISPPPATPSTCSSSRASPPAAGGPTNSCARPAATTSSAVSPTATTASRRPAAPTRTSSSRAICCASPATPATATAWSA